MYVLCLRPAPLARRTRLVLAPAVVWQSGTCTMQPIPHSRDVLTVYTALQRDCCGSGTPPWFPLEKNLASFTKPEVHNKSQCRQRTIEPQLQSTCASTNTFESLAIRHCTGTRTSLNSNHLFSSVYFGTAQSLIATFCGEVQTFLILCQQLLWSRPNGD